MSFKKEQKERNNHVSKRMRLFGFDEFKIDEQGFLVIPNLLNNYKIKLYARNQKQSQNSIDIGKGKNGKWSYGINYCTGAAGGGGCASIFGEVCSSEIEAKIKGLEELIKSHLKEKKECMGDGLGNYNDAYSKQIVEEAHNQINKLCNKQTKKK